MFIYLLKKRVTERSKLDNKDENTIGEMLVLGQETAHNQSGVSYSIRIQGSTEKQRQNKQKQRHACHIGVCAHTCV